MCWYALDQEYPYVQFEGKIVRWTRGSDAFAVASSSCVRLNERGLRFFPDHWKVLDLGSKGWTRLDCAPSSDMLCHAAGLGSVFSAVNLPSVNPNRWWKQCSQATTGQVLNFSAGYDISSCDVLGANSDVVWHDHVLYVNHGIALNWFEYLILCVLCIYAIRTFSTVVLREDDKERRETDFLGVFVCVIGILVICALSGDSVYVTLEDQFAFGFVMFYILFDVFVFLCNMFYQKLSWFPLYSVMISAFVLVVMRLYTGICTPYNGFLLWAIGARFSAKLMHGQWSVLLFVSLLLDSFLLSVLAVLGTPYSHPVLFAILFVSVITSDVLTKIHF